jgi:hypothetical protein
MFRDQWLRCSAKGNACVRVTGEQKQCANSTCVRIKIGVQPNYKLTKKDLGHRLRVRVAAWNGAGRATSTSNRTRIIKKYEQPLPTVRTTLHAPGPVLWNDPWARLCSGAWEKTGG